MATFSIARKIEDWVRGIMTIKAEIELKTTEIENEQVKDALFAASKGLTDAFHFLRVAYEKLTKE